MNSSSYIYRKPLYQNGLKAIMNRKLPDIVSYLCLIIWETQGIFMNITFAFLIFSHEANPLTIFAKQVSRFVLIGESLDFQSIPSLSETIFYTSFFYIMLSLMLTIKLFLSYRNGYSLSSFETQLWDYISYCHIKIFSFPIMTINLMIVSLPSNSEDSKNLPLSHMYALAIISQIWNFLFTGFLIFGMTSSIMSEDFLSSKTKSHKIYAFLQRTVLWLIYKFLADQDSKTAVLIFFNFIFEGFRTYKNATIFPYYNLHIQKASLKLALVNLTLCLYTIIAFIVSQFVSMNLNSGYLFMLWAMLVPAVLKTAENYMNSQYHNILIGRSTNLYKNLQLIPILDHYLLARTPRFGDHKIENFLIRGFELSQAIKDEQNNTTFDFHFANEEQKNFFIEKYLKGIIKQHPKSFLARITYLLHLVTKQHNFIEAIGLIQKMSQEGLSFSEKIDLEHIKCMLEERMSNKGDDKSQRPLDMKKYFEVVAHMDLLTEKIKVQIKAQLKFWKLYVAPVPDSFGLYQTSQKIEGYKKLNENIWNELNSLIPIHYTKPFMLYGLYMSLINYQPGKSIKLLKNKRFKSKVFEYDQLVDDMMYDEDTHRVEVSASKDDFGKIAYISKEFVEAHGYDANIIGNDLSTILPKDFKTAHRHAILRYFKTGKVKTQGKSNKFFFEDPNGYLIPVLINYSMSPSLNDKPKFIAFFRHYKPPTMYILISKDGHISNYSESIEKLLGIRRKSLIRMVEFSPSLSKLFAALDHNHSTLSLKHFSDTEFTIDPEASYTREDGYLVNNDTIEAHSKYLNQSDLKFLDVPKNVYEAYRNVSNLPKIDTQEAKQLCALYAVEGKRHDFISPFDPSIKFSALVRVETITILNEWVYKFKITNIEMKNEPDRSVIQERSNINVLNPLQIKVRSSMEVDKSMSIPNENKSFNMELYDFMDRCGPDDTDHIEDIQNIEDICIEEVRSSLEQDPEEKVGNVHKSIESGIESHQESDKKKGSKNAIVLKFLEKNRKNKSQIGQSSVGSRMSNNTFFGALESAVVEEYVKRRYLIFEALLICLMIVVVILISYMGLFASDSHTAIKGYGDILINSYNSVDSLVMIFYGVRLMKIGRSGIMGNLSLDYYNRGWNISNEMLNDTLDIFRDLKMSLVDSTPELKAEYFDTPVRLYDYEVGQGIQETFEERNIFKAQQILINGLLKIIEEDPNFAIPSRNHDYEYYIANSLLNIIDQYDKVSEFADQYLVDSIITLMKNVDVIVAISFALLGLYILVTISIFLQLNRGAYDFYTYLGKVEESSTEEIVLMLEEFEKVLEGGFQNIDDLLEYKRPVGFKKKSDRSRTKNFKSFNFKNIVMKNLLTIVELWPPLIPPIAAIALIAVVSKNSLLELQSLQEQSSLLIKLNYNGDLGFIAAMDFVLNDGNQTLRGYPIEDEIRRIFREVGDSQNFLNTFRKSDGTTNPDQYTYLYNSSCLSKQVSPDASLYELCLYISGGNGYIGLVNVNSFLEKEVIDYLNVWKLSDKTDKDKAILIARNADFLYRINLFQVNLVATLTEITNQLFFDQIQYEKNFINTTLIIGATLTALLIIVMYKISLFKVRVFDNKLKQILRLIPVTIISTNRWLSVYLVNSSRRYGPTLKRLI